MVFKAARIRPGPRNVDQHAHVLAEKVTETWYGHHGSGQLEVPVSVVAALSLIKPPFKQRHELAAYLINLDQEPFVGTLRDIWRLQIRSRPDLANRMWPLIEPWESESRPASPESVRSAVAVGRAVLTYDLLSLTGTEMRWETDLLGTVLTVLRPKSSLQARGQYYTPGPLSELMARMLGIADGESVHDPCCGTGGMLRAAAVEMRRAGRDPADCTWVGVDIDGLAVACCAVNVVTWGLGLNVLLGVGDSLRNDWWDRAIAEREETMGIARDMRMLGLLRHVTDLVDQAAGEQDDPDTDDGAEPAAEPAPPAHPEHEPELVPVDEEEPLPPPPAVVDETPGFWGLVDIVTGQQ